MEVYQKLAVRRPGINLLSAHVAVRGSRRSSGQELQLPNLGISKSQSVLRWFLDVPWLRFGIQGSSPSNSLALPLGSPMAVRGFFPVLENFYIDRQEQRETVVGWELSLEGFECMRPVGRTEKLKARSQIEQGGWRQIMDPVWNRPLYVLPSAAAMSIYTVCANGCE